MTTLLTLHVAAKDEVSALDIGEAIRTARRSKGLKQENLGHEVRCAPSYITHLERGRMAPSLDLARKLEAALELPAVVS